MVGALLSEVSRFPAKDEALRAATAEIAPRFHQCRACSDWVCGDVCWNDSVGQCVRCSPIATEELAQLQAEARRRQVQERLETVDLVGATDLKTQAQPRCGACGAQSRGGKFCGECGSPLAVVTTCRGCGTDNAAGAKFCAECGTSLAG